MELEKAADVQALKEGTVFPFTCSKCKKQWSKLTPKGQCPDCDPEHLVPKNKIEKPAETSSFKKEVVGNKQPDYFQN
jgi:DNA-directed RNA polymerase subunit RPC12/RpoP